ncbi:Tfp pilus assembly protein FimT/FimU [uncultured Acinetobacter sp.]|uniref:pilus assembly FimT family protein n=1 Tax=uncultured Acinetobacter sp. TaxID=165433 RepID=UPI002609A27C|nr:GspH/FimT family pseudopilin [uncultured Acinetobacter sp.]
MQKNKGFTLIELMVTIAVLAIVTMMAAPSFGNLLLKQNLNRSTQNLIGQLNNARSKAVLERRDVTVVLNSLIEDTPTQLNWSPQGKSILKAGSPTSITFLVNGGVKDYDAQIKNKSFKICDQPSGRKSKDIVISLMGTVTLSEGTCV